MSDEKQMEMAEALDQSLRDKALAVVRARANEAVPQDFDGKHCYDCGGAIPKGRLELDKFRCVECQGIFECGRRR